MNQNNVFETNQRRSFLTKLAGSAAALGVSMFAKPFTLHAERNAIRTPVTEEADDWFTKINGKHKMVFDVTQPHSVFPFAWPRVFLLTNELTGTPEKDSNAVIVFRHNAVPYAMEDRLWEKYKLGEAFGINDHLTNKPALRNPFWQPKLGEFTIPGIGNVAIGINELQNSGAMFCVCNMALSVNSAVIAGKMNLDAIEVKKDFASGLLPGVQLVPSGIWALGRAQEHGCGYCFAS